MVGEIHETYVDRGVSDIQEERALWIGLPLVAAMAVSLPLSPLASRLAQPFADRVAGEQPPIGRGLTFWLDVLGWYPAFFVLFLAMRAIPPRWRLRLAAVALGLLVSGGVRPGYHVSDGLTIRSLRPEALLAYDVLEKAEIFDGPNYLGYFDNAAAFRVIRKEPHADAIFKSLLRRGNVAGQMYALCGLYFTDHKKFESLIHKYEVRTDMVIVYMGDAGEEVPVGRLVKSRSPLAVRIKRGQTPEEWAAGWSAK
jgi:hypothetical protein